MWFVGSSVGKHMSCSRSSMLVFVRVDCACTLVLRWHFGTKDLSGNFLSRCVKADLWGLWVGGEPRKTTTVNGTVPLKPLYKGQVGSVGAFSSNDVTAQMSSTTLAMPSRSPLTT